MGHQAIHYIGWYLKCAQQHVQNTNQHPVASRPVKISFIMHITERIIS
jgi:hypothetical protein